MKIRNGFVSNSSSSSFLIYGIYLDEISDELLSKFYDENLEVLSPPDGYSVYVGLSWDEVGDDETGKQFKDRVQSSIKKVYDSDVNFSTYSEAWYDG